MQALGYDNNDRTGQFGFRFLELSTRRNEEVPAEVKESTLIDKVHLPHIIDKLSWPSLNSQ
jgi:hypothetical protein